MNWLKYFSYWLWEHGLRRRPPRAVIIDLDDERTRRRVAALLDRKGRA